MTGRTLVVVLIAVVGSVAWWLVPRDAAQEDNVAPADGTPSDASAPRLIGGADTPAPVIVAPKIEAEANDRPLTSAALPPPPTPTSGLSVLEGLVRRDGVPVAEGEGLLWRAPRHMPSLFDLPVHDPPTRTTSLTPDGRFRFERVEKGAWMLGVRLRDGVTHMHQQQHETGSTSVGRQVIELGTAVVYGSVYDDEGQPATKATVQVREGRGRGLVAHVQTDGKGRYRLADMPAGHRWVVMASRGDFRDAAQTESQHVTIAPNEEHEVSFGSPAGRVLLAGTVQCRDGTPMPGPGAAMLTPVEDGGVVQLHYDERGRFSRRVAPGIYRVRILAIGPAPVLRQEVRGDIQDAAWVVPGTRLVGRLISDAGPLKHLTVSVGARGASVDEQGNYAVYGLGAGRREVTVHHKLYRGSAFVEIPENADEVRCDVRLEPRR